MRPDKKKIHTRFSRATATYDRQAVIQRRVAARLLALLDENCTRPPQRVLEIGCSTGILTAMLTGRYKAVATLYVNDLVPEFHAMVREKVGDDLNLVFLPGDIESIALPSDLDLIISSSTFHWLHNLPALFDRLHGLMAPGGILCFAMYGPENLFELRAIAGIGLDYPSPADLTGMLKNRFQVLACEGELVSFHFADPRTLLDHLRQTGVNALDATPWTRSRLNDFIRRYARHYGGPDGVALTYHPVYCVAGRRHDRGAER
jgi:malonyl-CoA O-methyltransferase